MNTTERILATSEAAAVSIPMMLNTSEILEVATEIRRLQAQANEWKKRAEGMSVQFDPLRKERDELQGDVSRGNVLLRQHAQELDTMRADLDRVRDELAAAHRVQKEEADRNVELASDLKVAQEEGDGLRDRAEAAEAALRSARGLVEAFLLHNPEGSLNDAIRILGNTYRQKRADLDAVSKMLEEQRERTAEAQRRTLQSLKERDEALAQLSAARSIVDDYLPENQEANLVEAVKLLGARFREAREGHRVEGDSVGALTKTLEAERKRSASYGEAALAARVERDAANVERDMAQGALRESNQARNLLARRLDEAMAARDRIKEELAHAAAERDELQGRLDTSNHFSNLQAETIQKIKEERDNWITTAEARRGAFEDMQQQRDRLQAQVHRLQGERAEERAHPLIMRAAPWGAEDPVIKAHVDRIFKARLAKQVGPNVDVLERFLSDPPVIWLSETMLADVRGEIRKLLDRNELLSASEQHEAAKIPKLQHEIEELRAQRDKALQVVARVRDVVE